MWLNKHWVIGMTFGEIVRNAREKSNLSQEDVAKAIEKKYNIRLSPSYLSMIENGTRTNLTVNLLSALLDFFNLPFETTLSLFMKPAFKNAYFFETTCKYQIDELANLPEEARRSLEDYKEYIIKKYQKT